MLKMFQMFQNRKSMTLTNIGIYLLNPSLVLVGIGEEYVIQLILKRMIFFAIVLTPLHTFVFNAVQR